MSLAAWLVLALLVGAAAGVEAWAWMRHGTSAIALAITGAVSLSFGLILVALVLAFGYGIASGITGWDPVGLADPQQTSSDAESCDPNYEGACLDPEASDYDCAEGTGDGPAYTGAVRVIGIDVHDLDRDGDGSACE